MRLANRVVARHKGILGPATEIIRPNSTTSTNGVVTGGATAHGVLSDQTEDSYIDTQSNITTVPIWVGGFADLAQANGRNIASFVVHMVMNAAGGPEDVTLLPTIAGVVLNPLSAVPQFQGGGPSEDLTGEFFKSGGGSFTEAQINSLVVQLGPSQGGTSLVYTYETWVVVTYS